MISIKNLSKSFGKKEVLSQINLDFQKGNVYGIVGENGSGKTTLFRSIAGLIDCDGFIESDFKVLKNHVGFLDTNPIFMSHITGWEYLKLLSIARGLSHEGFESQNIFELPLNEYCENYSTGMKKKLALMAILIQGNDCFILDEPFNGVDIQSNFLITEIIKTLRAKSKIVIISSHIFSTLSDNCDKIFLLKEGRIAQEVAKENFQQLDEDMKKYVIGDKVRKLNIF